MSNAASVGSTIELICF